MNLPFEDLVTLEEVWLLGNPELNVDFVSEARPDMTTVIYQALSPFMLLEVLVSSTQKHAFPQLHGDDWKCVDLA